METDPRLQELERRMQPYERETLRRIRELLPRILPNGAKAILYGSRARGDARPDSDWDILVILDQEKLRGNDYGTVYPLVEMGWGLDQYINPITYARGEWEAFPFTPFYNNVKQDGIKLWD